MNARQHRSPPPAARAGAYTLAVGLGHNPANIARIASVLTAAPPAAEPLTGWGEHAGDPTANVSVVWRDEVAAATTGPVDLHGTQVVDGVCVSTGAVVLVKDQAAAADNGIWSVRAGAWTRHELSATGPAIHRSAVLVRRGTVNGGLRFVNVNEGPIVLGVTAIRFVQLADPREVVGQTVDGTLIWAPVGARLISSFEVERDRSLARARRQVEERYPSSRGRLSSSIADRDSCRPVVDPWRLPTFVAGRREPPDELERELARRRADRWRAARPWLQRAAAAAVSVGMVVAAALIH